MIRHMLLLSAYRSNSKIKLSYLTYSNRYVELLLVAVFRERIGHWLLHCVSYPRPLAPAYAC